MSQSSQKQTGADKASVVCSGASGAAGSPALESASRPAGLNDRWTVPGVCIFLAVITIAVFGQTLHHEFLCYDDNLYVCENVQVAKGLTLKGIAQAFTHGSYDNWDPLTTISHMLDCQFYGLNAGGHHLTNILLHTASAILLFLVLRRMTGALWRSAFVAAVFAVHPLRVESVAWVAERKDVLSGVFFMLTIGAYVRYVRHPWSPVRYGLVVLLFALGLMCKPMLMTLPFVLLLLDYWPLNRLRANVATQPVFRLGGRLVSRRLILEKLPLLGLAVASGVATLFAQKRGIQTFDQISLPLRVGNALISYVAYLGQMFWPSDLAVLYPFTAREVGVSGVVPSLVLLAGISAGAFVLHRQRPYFLTGWLWYLIMLVPVIGVVQVGAQTRADRYTYLPQIGLYVLLTWAVADLCAGWRHRRVVRGGFSTIILVALIFCARVQTSYWQNGESLWIHTLACTSDNAFAHNNLGNELFQKGRVDEAITHYQKALEIKPDYAEAYYNLGNCLFKRGSVDEAIVHFQKALEIKPDYAEAHNNLGYALIKKGKVDEAMVHYQKALEIKPDYAEAHYNLGYAFLQKGKVDEAMVHFQKVLEIKPESAEAHYNLGNAFLQKGSVDEAMVHFQKAVTIKPDYADAHNNLGNTFLQKGKVDEAIIHYQKVLEIKPDCPETQNNLALVLATSAQASLRNGNKAVELAQQANQLTGGKNPTILHTLAAAYAEAGRFGDARRSAQEAIELARAMGQQNLVEQLNGELKLYEAGRSFHEGSQ